MNISEAEQHEAPARVARWSWGETWATPGMRAILSRFSAGIQTGAGLPISKAVSTLISAPSGTISRSAPSRPSTTCKLARPPSVMKVTPKGSAASNNAQPKTTPLRNPFRVTLR